MQVVELSVYDSIRALLHSIGFRPEESKRFAEGLRTCKNPDDCTKTFLSELLDGPLLTHVENAILRLLKESEPTCGTLWDLLVLIWNNVKYNIAVASHRLQAALQLIAEEPIVSGTRVRISSQPRVLAVAS